MLVSGVPEYLVVFAVLVMYAMGFLTCGSLIGTTPFWHGVRDAFCFRWWRR